MSRPFGPQLGAEIQTADSFQKSQELFNLHRAIKSTRDRVIVVEGFFDCVKIHQAGFPNVVALMGSSLSDDQLKLLQSFGHAVLCLDGDEAGRGATKQIAGQFWHKIYVRVVEVPDHRQPDQLSTEEIKTLLV